MKSGAAKELEGGRPRLRSGRQISSQRVRGRDGHSSRGARPLSQGGLSLGIPKSTLVVKTRQYWPNVPSFRFVCRAKVGQGRWNFILAVFIFLVRPFMK